MTRMRVGGPVWANGTIPEGTVLGRPVGGGVKPLTPAEVATILSTPSSSTIGNLLTANQASVETDLTGWAASTNASIARSASTALHGSASLAATCTAASGNVTWALTSGVGNYASVVVGGTYTGVAHVKAGVTARNAYCYIDWRDTGNASVGTSTGSAVSVGTSGWTRIEVTGVAPAGAAYARLVCTMNAAVLDDTMFMDCAGIWAGAGGLWAMPGVPITGTGRRVRHPSVDDVCVEAWDSTQNRWQVAHYDTGRRSLTLANGWTATAATVRRVGYAVEVVFTGLNGASASSGTVLTLDSAFRPPYALVQQIGNTASTFPDKVVTVGTDGTVVVGGTYANVTAGSLVVRMFTGAAVPTSLSGTLVSSAPYN